MKILVIPNKIINRILTDQSQICCCEAGLSDYSG